MRSFAAGEREREREDEDDGESNRTRLGGDGDGVSCLVLRIVFGLAGGATCNLRVVREGQAGELQDCRANGKRGRMGILEKIDDIKKEMARTQKNKATNGHLGLLKAKLAKLRTELLTEGCTGTGNSEGEGFAVAKSGDGRVALIGFPSVGKSTLLDSLTTTESAVGSYEFTTLTCIPGNVMYKGTKIQLLDLPGIIDGASEGKGRGREVIAVAKTSDVVMMILDAGAEHSKNHRGILEVELEACGLRLNKTPPNITFRQKKTGGVKVNMTVPLTFMGSTQAEAAKNVHNILKEYRIFNCELMIRCDCTPDEIIDVIEGNRKYIRCLYVYNKVDTITIEDCDRLARLPNTIVISVHAQLNLDRLLEKMWEYLGLTRIYTKRKGGPPDFSEPVVLTQGRRGLTVESACKTISGEMLKIFNFAMVWGTSTKHSPQRCGLTHKLEDEDVVQVVTKTVTQQKHSKEYNKQCQEVYDNYKLKKKNKKPLKT